MIEKIISAGRSGAEHAALDVAIRLGIGYGGWIPKDVSLPAGMDIDRYHLIEMPTSDRAETLKKNIRESDVTLMLSHGTLSSRVKNAKKTLYKDEHQAIQQMIYKIFEIILQDKNSDLIYPMVFNFITKK